MYLLPIDKYTITTEKTKEQVISKIQSHLSETSSKLKRNDYNHRLLKGKFCNGVFYVTTQFMLQFYQSERYKNNPFTLEPYIKISVKSNSSGADVNVFARPHISFLMFMLIFVVSAIYLAIIYLNDYMETGNSQLWYIPICIIAFVVVFIYFSFWLYEIKARKLIREIIGCLYINFIKDIENCC